MKIFNSFEVTLWILLMFLDRVLFAMNWLLKHSWKKLGPFGVTVLTWAGITLFAFLLPSMLSGCSGARINNTTKEKTMIVRFFNYVDITIPLAPGAIDTNFFAPLANDYFGIEMPYLRVPVAADATDGCNPNSNIKILRHRQKVLGAPGMLPGIPPTGGIPVWGFTFGRDILDVPQGYSGLIVLPFGFDGEWQEDQITLISNGSGLKRPKMWELGVDWTFDTRNIDPFYRGKTARLVFEIEVECSTIVEL